MSCELVEQTITVTRDVQFIADVVPPAPTNIAGWTLRFRAFRKIGATPVLTLALGDGLGVVDAGTGVVRVYITPTRTAAIPAGTYLWDLERTDADAPFQMAGGPFVVLDPTGGPSPAPPTCPSPEYVPSYGKLFGNSFRGQRPTAVVPSGSPAAIKVALFTPTGQPAVVVSDASGGGYCGPADVRAGVSEAVRGNPCPAAAELTADGMFVRVELPEGVWRTPGVYDLEVRADDTEGAARAAGRAIVYVEPSPLGGWLMGPPLLDDIRITVRDYPAANRLLGSYEFSATEIATAVVQAVRGFNAAPPNSVELVTTATWHRDTWDNLIDGVMAELFDTSAAYYRRGHLPYAAGGVQVDDMAKEDEYLKAAYVHRERWDKWVKLTKMAMNIEGAFGSMLTDYTNNW